MDKQAGFEDNKQKTAHELQPDEVAQIKDSLRDKTPDSVCLVTIPASDGSLIGAAYLRKYTIHDPSQESFFIGQNGNLREDDLKSFAQKEGWWSCSEDCDINKIYLEIRPGMNARELSQVFKACEALFKTRMTLKGVNSFYKYKDKVMEISYTRHWERFGSPAKMLAKIKDLIKKDKFVFQDIDSTDEWENLAKAAEEKIQQGDSPDAIPGERLAELYKALGIGGFGLRYIQDYLAAADKLHQVRKEMMGLLEYLNAARPKKLPIDLTNAEHYMDSIIREDWEKSISTNKKTKERLSASKK